MKNLYVFYDSVSGNSGDVFQAENDLVMRRSAVRALASVPPEIAHDTVVLQVGIIDSDENGCPIIQPSVPLRTAFAGSSPEVEQFRSALLLEAQRFSTLRGDSCEE